MATASAYWQDKSGNVVRANTFAQARDYESRGFTPTTQQAQQIQPFITELQKSYNDALTANKEREKQATALYDQIIAEANKIGSGELSQLEQTKKKDVASATQSLVSAGLGNTTRSAMLGKKWEQDVGTPARQGIATKKAEALSSAYAQKAQFIQNIQDTYPDYSTIANLILQSYA